MVKPGTKGLTPEQLERVRAAARPILRFGDGKPGWDAVLFVEGGGHGLAGAHLHRLQQALNPDEECTVEVIMLPSASRDPILDRYAKAAAQGEADRAARTRGELDHWDIRERRRADLRKAVGMDALAREASKARTPIDPSQALWVFADLRDDGFPDWVFSLDNPSRRYRLRPWRDEDGPPLTDLSPCITVIDFKQGGRLAGVPIGALKDLGCDEVPSDTDNHAAIWFSYAVRGSSSGR